MDNEEKNINQLIKAYNEKMLNIQLPEMKVEDLLDLIDYYSQNGADFEAELYKRIAAIKFPTHPDVILMCAHWEADEGNWKEVENICSTIDSTKYDESLFHMEKMLRMMMPQEAFKKAEETLSPLQEVEDNDFLFDAAELFRDFGYMKYALDCLKQIPKSYPDYQQVLELSAECSFYTTDFDSSLRALDEAIDKNPFDDYLWTQTAMIQYRKGFNDKALDACEYSLAIQKENPRAIHLKNILKWESNGEFDVAATAFLRQDYSAMLEIGDLYFGKADYKHAEAQYMAAGYFCPRGNRDRLQIVYKTALCRLAAGRTLEAIDAFLSAISLSSELWPYMLEFLNFMMNHGDTTYTDQLLCPLIKIDIVATERLEEVITLLDTYKCYKDAAKTWKILSEKVNEYTPKNQETVKQALKFCDEDF